MALFCLTWHPLLCPGVCPRGSIEFQAFSPCLSCSVGMFASRLVSDGPRQPAGRIPPAGVCYSELQTLLGPHPRLHFGPPCGFVSSPTPGPASLYP